MVFDIAFVIVEFAQRNFEGSALSFTADTNAAAHEAPSFNYTGPREIASNAQSYSSSVCNKLIN